jgi:sialate O-acetylesterase
MNRQALIKAVLAAAACLLSSNASVTQAEVKLANVIASNMVLQREKPLPVWGWADAGEEVTVSIAGSSATAKAGESGKWMVKLPAMKAGGPHKMTIKGSNTIELSNILVGEVWVCSGQSNMEWSLARAANAKEEIAAAKYPKLRLFHVKKSPQVQPQKDVELTTSWKECSPTSVPNFSAVAYFFGRHLHTELDIPIGVIETAWGGTRIEPWTPPVGFKQVPALKSLVETAAEVAGRDPKVKVSQQTPTVLYNGMVHGLVPFAVRGAIWYQGESNRADGMLYHEKMKGLILGWRKIWNDDQFPFLFVQLAPYKYGNDADDVLPKIWEAQTATLAIPNTGMAVITDIGNLKNIHPTNKQDVGKRLALWALAKTYQQKILVYSGPLYKSHKVEGNTVRLSFDHVGSGLAARDDKPLTWFTIAGADGKFVEATASIDGETLVVSSENVAKPQAVRFGWSQLAEPNFGNKEGLPASPFRTDR